VVLLHDAGGDRSATVAALPLIIDYLRRRGDEIVPLHQLVGVSRDAFMPSLPPNDPGEELLIADVGFHLLHLLERFGWAFMIATTALLLLRTVVLLVLAVRNRIQQHGKADVQPDMAEPVSVLIAAHNESAVIEATLASVLTTGYRGGIEVVVVDDGSDDETATLVARAAQHDTRVKLIRQSQKGKAAALNAALRIAAHELIVMLDADTQFRPDTIGRLLFPLKDKEVGAVSGHARVGNRTSWITLFQSLEYTCGFNLDRRAYDQWNCVTVVPGAVSAFRKSAIMEAGGLSEDTMAEDTDLTLMIHRLGYKVAYAPTAVAFTEAPDTIAGLVRQRTRWAFGTLQCLIKHNELLFNPQYKGLAFFSVPSTWFFHFFLVALIPAVDALLIFSLLNGAGSAILDYALAFMAVDMITALAACIMEGEQLRQAWLILPMRLLYRPVLAWSVWKAIIRALRGAWFAWGHQERRGLIPAMARVSSEPPIATYREDEIAGR
jgi:cellulose synthase/poly-beta-1,6-N-acetylglucosamine synthase-like glycosyltransferase